MIEELESEAVLQMVREERGQSRSRVSSECRGAAIEVRARRRKDGGVVLGYSYGGYRLERTVLLLLLCPQVACERSQSAKAQWASQNPMPPPPPTPPPPPPRRPRTAVKATSGVTPARLFEDVLIASPHGQCVARPASFAVLVRCPLHAHAPALVRMCGWDLFRAGEYIAGGLVADDNLSAPLFPNVRAAETWVESIGKITPHSDPSAAG